MSQQGYVADIGIECHVQLKTRSKLFCGCDNDARAAEPNTTVCEVCFGLPGTLPVLNKRAVELAIQAGIALNAEVARETKFDRKNYFYPDLPKGYQITQYDHPIVGSGEITVPMKGEEFNVEIIRAHLEEDAGKLVHPEGVDYSLVDLNRAGTPLLEIVSGPSMHTPQQAKAYAQDLYYRMLYAGVSDVDLYHGNMRFDLNISVRPEGSSQYGVRTETKNLNSFKSVERAATYEIDRQIQLLSDGEEVQQQTRGWDEQQTYLMRTKEEADDYRYFPEPDIPPVVVSRDWQQVVADNMPTTVETLRQRFHTSGISMTQQEALLNHPELAYLQDQVMTAADSHEVIQLAANILSGEAVRLLQEQDGKQQPLQLDATRLLELVQMAIDDELSSTGVKEVLGELMYSTAAPRAVAEEQGILQLSDVDALEEMVDTVIAKNPGAADDVRNGELKAIGFLTGQVMRHSQGQANPQKVQELLKQKLQPPS